MSQAPQRHVLIIDRWEDRTGELVALVLQRQRGDRTQIIGGGDKGLQAIQEELPDAIFIYLWAHDPSTLDFCQQIRATSRTEHVPVIVWGAKAPSQICPQLRDAGATGYLYQPSMPDKILAARDAALASKTYFPSSYVYC